MKYLISLFFWFICILPSIVLGGSTTIIPSAIPLSDNIHISDIVLVVTLMAGLLSIISVTRGKHNRRDIGVDQFNTLKNEMRIEYKERDTKIVEFASKIHELEENLIELDSTINNSIKKKIYVLSEHFKILEQRVIDLDKHFDQSNLDRKEDTRQFKSDINTLRENIRDDINDVKDIIMKLMMALKIDTD